jgi:acyl-CoA thioesterase FadM
MDKIKIDWPDPVVFSTDLDIRITDINYGGHLGNDRVLSLVHEARVRMFAAHGWAELDIDGAGTIMCDAAIQFKGEVFHGMNVRVEVGVAELGRSSFTLLYGLRDSATGDELARVRTGTAFYDYEARKVVRAPQAFVDALSA